MSFTENVVLDQENEAASAPAHDIIVASQNASSTPTECFACCESFNNSTRALVGCEGCDFAICKGCVRTYLTSTASDPHCMNCKKGWSQKFIVANLNQTWVSKDYKEHRKKFLTDQQIAKLPESMAAAAQYKKKEEYKKQADAVKEKLNQARAAARQLEEEHRQLLHAVYRAERGQTSGKSEIKFMMPCPVDDCRGLLSTAYKCEICKTYACSKCLVPTGHIRDDPNHVCNEDDVKSAQLIKDSTKPCPGCGERIFKTSGCDQMWCTKCHTTFSWRTSAIITNTNIHNPHYYEWQRKNGTNGNAIRNPGDVVCGGLAVYYTFNRAIKVIVDSKTANTVTISPGMKEDIVGFYARLHRFASHISYYDLDRERARVRTCSEFQLDRVHYINKVIDRAEFGKRIIQKDKNRRRAVDKVHIYEMINAVLIDLVGHIINNRDSANAFDIMLQKKKEMYEFAIYCNKQFQELSAVQNCKVPQLDPETWNFTSQKFSAKQIGL